MSQQAVSPERMRRQANLMNLVNVPMRLILRLPFATPLSGNLMLLYLTGRKTGKAYLQPVSYVVDGDTLLTPGGGKWKWNLQAGQPVRVRLRGRVRLARPDLIGDLDEVERLLRRMIALNPRVMAFVPVAGADGQIDRGRLENAVKHGFRIVRWHVEGRPSP
jgi:deazaflavin-dependent oxidoreductase (nitroreductase family)